MIDSFLEGHVGDHIAAALPRRHRLKYIQLPEYHPDPGRGKDLMTRKDIEVAIVQLHIHRNVRHRLSPVHDSQCPVTVCDRDHLRDRSHCPECVRNLCHRHKLCMRVKELLILFQDNLTIVVHRSHPKLCALFSAQHLPGNDVRMMLEPGDNDLIILLDIAASPTLRDQIDALGRPAHKDDFLCGRCVQEPSNSFPRPFISISRPRSQRMRGTVYVRILVRVVVRDSIDHRLRLVCRGRIVQPDQLSSIDAFFQDWKIPAYRINIKQAG